LPGLVLAMNCLVLAGSQALIFTSISGDTKQNNQQRLKV